MLMLVPAKNKGPDNCHTCGMDKNPPARLVWHGQEPACTTASGHAIAQPARPVCGNPARTTLSGPDDPAARTTQPFQASDPSPF